MCSSAAVVLALRASGNCSPPPKFFIGNVRYQISYSGGSGNDVALNVVGVNNAPVLSGVNILTAGLEDVPDAANTGTLVSAIVAGQIADTDGPATGWECNARKLTVAP